MDEERVQGMKFSFSLWAYLKDLTERYEVVYQLFSERFFLNASFRFVTFLNTSFRFLTKHKTSR